MARKVKSKRTVKKRRITRRIRQKKTSKNISYLAIIVVIILFVFAIYYFSLSKGLQQPNQQPDQQPSGTTPTTSGQGAAASVGGYCKTKYECFITSCKGQTEDCVNTTQLTFYSKKCNSYPDWVVGRQDISRCSCITNACTMIK